jgi:hypothetical protein
VQLLENAATAQVGHHPLTEAEQRKRDDGITEETIAIDRLWNMTDQYVKRAKHVAEAQYAPLKSALQKTLGLHEWTVNQRSFLAGARSLNEQDLHDNLAYFKVPQAGIDSIRSKLAFKIFDEYANILKGMYSTRFNGHPKNKGDHDQMDTAPGGPSPPLITSLQAWQPNKIRRQKEKEKKGVG